VVKPKNGGTRPTPRIKMRFRRDCPSGRARAGSRLQLQEYVNVHTARLSQEISANTCSGSNATVRWVSPLASDNYREYRDAEFMNRLGLGSATDALRLFWPRGGPCWDALGLIDAFHSHSEPMPLLVEAKSHLSELYGSGCKAEQPHSIEKIQSALSETKTYWNVNENADWMGSLYQYANRLANLYFFLRLLNRPAWLINVYFTNDPIGATNIGQWKSEIAKVKGALGLSSENPKISETFLLAVSR
jgi:hypothetical protein